MSQNNNQKYILVTGGELFNKGAQAMTFIVVNLHKRKLIELNIF